MSGDSVTYSVSDGVATITINRPDKLNALNPEVVEGLRDAWLRFEQGDSACAVLTGAGDRAFSAGADLEDNPLELWRGVPRLGVEVTKPIVAAVHGHCIGGAYVLVQQADLAVAAENTVFSYPEARVGFTGGIAAGTVVRIPHKVAMEFLLLGERMSARRAYEVGLINKVVPAGEQLQAAMEWARVIVDSAPLVVDTLHRFAHETTPKSPSELAALARRDLARIHESEDRREGGRAFREKRAPRYTGS